MKHILSTITIALAAILSLTSCQKKEVAIVATTGLTMDKSSIELTVGEVVELNVTIKPENATSTYILWKTDNAKIATVDKFGRVYGIAKGNAVITATAQSDSKITTTCNVTVNEKP